MGSDTQASPQVSVDVKVAFRRPANDAANRKYRRRSPVSGSSSSDESPKHNHRSPIQLKEDLVDDHQGKDVRNFGRSGDRYEQSDYYSTRGSSHYRNNDYARHEKYVDDWRYNMKSSSRSRQEFKDDTHDDLIKFGKDELRSRKEEEKSPIDYETYKGSSFDRAKGSTRHTNNSMEDVRSIDRDNFKGDEHHIDGKRAYYKEDRLNRREEYYCKEEVNDRNRKDDYYKTSGDGQDEKRDYIGDKDNRYERRDYYKGSRKGRDERRDNYEGDRVERNEKRYYYKEERDTRDEKRTHRSSRSNSSPGYEDVKAHQNGLVSRDDPKKMNKQKSTKEQMKKYDDHENSWVKEEHSGWHLEDKYVSSDRGQESTAKKPKLFAVDGSGDHMHEVSKFTTVPGSKTSVSLDLVQKGASKSTSESSFVQNSGIDAAKVAAMKAAELVNRNLIGTGYLSTDQKKKLLWGNKKNSTAEESARHWDTTMFSDRERQEKFNKLMGVKGEMKVEQQPRNADTSGVIQSEKQKELQLDLEKQYTAGLRRRDGRTVGLGL